MPGLPPGWESDYDGTRWFYQYKPTGQVQYHFPSEGDEFPDYVDAASPAPALAPEERLESQQQVKRHGSTHLGGRSAATTTTAANTLPWQTPAAARAAAASRNSDGGPMKMSATARPVSFVWEGDELRDEGQGHRDEEDGVFRPESFMFLGPGAYNDVSPLVDEEEEAARRVVAGEARSKGVSPDVSTGTTPQVKKVDLETPSETLPMPSIDVATTAVVPVDQTSQEPSVAVIEAQVVHMIDGREMPLELPGSEPWQDPIGRVPEMATVETAPARIESHPDPVEIGEGKELTIVEAASESLEPELPVSVARESTIAEVAPVQEKEIATHEPARDSRIKPKEEAAAPSQGSSEGLASPHKHEEEKKRMEEPTSGSQYQPYKPGQAMPDIPPRRSDEMATHQSSLQRERSLMMGAGAGGGQQLDLSAIPDALNVSKPKPKDAASTATSTRTSQHVWPTPAQSGEPSPQPPTDQEGEGASVTGVEKFPSVLRPARGRATSQPKAPDAEEQHHDLPAQIVQHPPMMRPGPGHARHQSEGIPKKPPGGGVDVQPRTVYDGGQAVPYRGALNNQGPSDAEEPSSPQVAMAVPINVAAMQRAHSVMTRKAVPSAAQPAPGRVFEPSNQDSSAKSPPARERRHSSFSPSDVSPLTSHPGSTARGTPLETPSPMENMRRASIGVSLSQATSNSSSFTPSSVSITPPSGRQSVSSPLANAPLHPGLSENQSSEGSYFAQGARASPGLQRSQSLLQTPSPAESLGQSRDRLPAQGLSASPGHLLTSIEEHDENPSTHDGVSLSSQSPGLSRRHSLASSPNPSPGLPQQLPQFMRPGEQQALPQQQAENPIRAGPAMGYPQAQQMPGPMPPPGQQRVAPHVQMPMGQAPVSQHPHRRSMPAGMMPPGPIQQPTQHQVPCQQYEAPHGWRRQGAPPFNHPPGLVSASTVPQTPKEKDKKWTKWFKPSKSPASSPQPAQSPQASDTSGVQTATQAWPGQQIAWERQPQPGQLQPQPPHVVIPSAPRPPPPWGPHHIAAQAPHPPGQRSQHQRSVNRPLPLPDPGYHRGPEPGPQPPHDGPGPVSYQGHTGGPPRPRQPGHHALPGDQSYRPQQTPTSSSGGSWGTDGGRWA